MPVGRCLGHCIVRRCLLVTGNSISPFSRLCLKDDWYGYSSSLHIEELRSTVILLCWHSVMTFWGLHDAGCRLHWNDVWEDPLFGKNRGEDELNVRGPECGSWLGFCFAVWLVLCLVGVLVLLVAFLPSEPNYLLVSPILLLMSDLGIAEPVQKNHRSLEQHAVLFNQRHMCWKLCNYFGGTSLCLRKLTWLSKYFLPSRQRRWCH